MVFHQGGLLIIWVVFHHGGFSSEWSVVRVFFDQCVFSIEWSLYHSGSLSSGFPLHLPEFVPWESLVISLRKPATHPAFPLNPITDAFSKCYRTLPGHIFPSLPWVDPQSTKVSCIIGENDTTLFTLSFISS